MRQSKLFTKSRKEAPAGEVSKNAILLTRAGYIHKEMAGVYSYLPLGFRVLKKIENIIREEMTKIGGQEVFLTTLQKAEIWEKSGRWDDQVVDNWFKTNLHDGERAHQGSVLGMANTHEEPLTILMRDHLNSYRDLPAYAFQIQTKFRNELRAKSGIMRGREFLMKDLYSFSRNEAEFREFYERCAEAYLEIFRRVGLGEVTFRTFADGGSFSDFSDEFQTLSEAGEDIIYLHREKKLAVNREVYNEETLAKLNLKKEDLEEVKAIEVGNIFPLGTKFSEALDLKYIDEAGEAQLVFMGSYGIGLGRLLGAVAEVQADEAGLIWPESIAPFKLHLLNLGQSEALTEKATEIYSAFEAAGIEVLFDDRQGLTPGQKLAEADLLGLPYRAVISERLTAGQIELKLRRGGEVEILTLPEVLEKIK